MGNLDFSANADQLKELAAYMASQINVPTIGIGGGYAPIGTINFFDATVAPQDWLACDGSVYNIADYPQLAEWYATQHGASNFYGGDGTTTFAVPDLQGEFLRGTGTNSHTNQGSGANVGVHQDGTRHLPVGAATSSGRMYIYADELLSDGALNPDNIKSSQYDFSVVGQDNTRVIENYGSYTSRPTNTSFLICVKAVVAGEVYSTDERVVGTWIDGSKIYQKTINFGTLPNATAKSVAHGINGLSKLISAKANWIASGPYYGDLSIMSANDKAPINFWMDATALYLWSGSDYSSYSVYVTVQYTKISD